MKTKKFIIDFIITTVHTIKHESGDG